MDSQPWKVSVKVIKNYKYSNITFEGFLMKLSHMHLVCIVAPLHYTDIFYKISLESFLMDSLQIPKETMNTLVKKKFPFFEGL